MLASTEVTYIYLQPLIVSEDLPHYCNSTIFRR
jgi:hypothetical protein